MSQVSELIDENMKLKRKLIATASTTTTTARSPEFNALSKSKSRKENDGLNMKIISPLPSKSDTKENNTLEIGEIKIKSTLSSIYYVNELIE